LYKSINNNYEIGLEGPNASIRHNRIDECCGNGEGNGTKVEVKKKEKKKSK